MMPTSQTISWAMECRRLVYGLLQRPFDRARDDPGGDDNENCDEDFRAPEKRLILNVGSCAAVDVH
jgi:hypothetical protein